jgi:hypothetical protein
MTIHWLRAIAAAFLVELVLIVLTIPIAALVGIEAVIPFVPPACAVVGFPFGWWSARKMQSGYVVQGAVVGIFATLIYFGLVIGQAGSIRPAIELYGPLLFILAHAAKIAGCVTGAFACGRRQVARPVTA